MENKQDQNIPIQKQFERAQKKQNNLHFKRFSEQEIGEIKYILALIQNPKEAQKMEKKIKKGNQGNLVEQNKNLSQNQLMQKYVDILAKKYQDIANNNEFEGPLRQKSRGLRRWKVKIVCFNQTKNILYIKKVDKDEQFKLLNLEYFDKEFLGQEGKVFAFLLKAKKDYLKQVKQDKYRFGWEDYQYTMEWFIKIGGELPEKNMNSFIKNKSRYESTDNYLNLPIIPDFHGTDLSPSILKKQSSEYQQYEELEEDSNLPQIAPQQELTNQNQNRFNNQINNIVLNSENSSSQSPDKSTVYKTPKSSTDNSQFIYNNNNSSHSLQQNNEYKQQQQQQQLQKNRQQQNQVSYKKSVKQVKKNFDVPFLFQKLHATFDINQAQDETLYKCIKFNQNQRILQNMENQTQFKLILSLKATQKQVFKCISEPEHLINCNSNIQEVNVIDLMRSENTAIIYQKNKKVGTFYKAREFTYLRFCMPLEDDKIIVYDKSIDYEMKGGYTVQEGKINNSIILIAPHSYDKEQTILTINLDLNNGGFGNDSDNSITLTYLQSFENFQSYIDNVIKPLEEQKGLSTIFDIKLFREEEVIEKIEIPQIIQDEPVLQQQQVNLQHIKEASQEDDLDIQKLQENDQARKNQQQKEQVNKINQQTNPNELQLPEKISKEKRESSQSFVQDNIIPNQDEQEMEEELNRYAKNQIILNAAMYDQHSQSQNDINMENLFKLVESGQFQHICLDQKEYIQKPLPLDQEYEQIKSDENGNYIFKKNWKRDEKTGTMYFINEEVIKKQKKVLKFILKNMGGNMLSGKSLLSTSMPVFIFDTRSNLERTAYSFSFAPVFLEKAAQLEDPVEQMKLVQCFHLTCSLLYMEISKPFNPILGETYEGQIKGCPIYLEQISHHPPILAVQLYGRGYKLEGTMEASADMHANSVDGQNFGDIYVTFTKTRNKMTMIQPPGVVNNTVIGDRYLNLEQKSYVIDKQNKLVCEINYNPDKKGTFSFGKQKSTVDSFRGGIYQVSQTCIDKLNTKFSGGKGLKKLTQNGLKEKEDFVKQLSQAEGLWDQYIEFDKKVYFHYENGPYPYKMHNSKNPLPSDCNFRPDIIFYRKKDEKRAQEWKEKLENIQRADKKLREKFKKDEKKKNKN